MARSSAVDTFLELRWTRHVQILSHLLLQMVVQRQAMCRSCRQRNLHHLLSIPSYRVELMGREALLAGLALV